MKPKVQSVELITVTVAMVFLILWSESKLREERPANGRDSQVTFWELTDLQVPWSNVTMGYGGAIASTLWVSGLLELADDILLNQAGLRFSHLIRLTGSLDPIWNTPYYMSMVVEDSLGKPLPETIDVLEEGVRKFPSDWRLRVFLAMTILKFPGLELQARVDSGVRVMKILERESDSSVPAHIRNLAKVLAQGKANALSDLMLESYSTGNYLDRNRFRSELVDLLGRQTGRPKTDIEDFLSGLDALPAEDQEKFNSTWFLQSADGSEFLKQFRKRRDSIISSIRRP